MCPIGPLSSWIVIGEAGYWRGERLGEMLRTRARATPARVAVVDGARRWTYQELDERADRMAAGLRRLGIAQEQRVLVQLPNIAEFLPLCCALFRIGAIPVLALPAHRGRRDRASGRALPVGRLV